MFGRAQTRPAPQTDTARLTPALPEPVLTRNVAAAAVEGASRKPPVLVSSRQNGRGRRKPRRSDQAFDRGVDWTSGSRNAGPPRALPVWVMLDRHRSRRLPAGRQGGHQYLDGAHLPGVRTLVESHSIPLAPRLGPYGPTRGAQQGRSRCRARHPPRCCLITLRDEDFAPKCVPTEDPTRTIGGSDAQHSSFRLIRAMSAPWVVEWSGPPFHDRSSRQTPDRTMGDSRPVHAYTTGRAITPTGGR